MKYILDANTFIEAKNKYYGMAICPAYWEWLLAAHDNGHVISITFVKDEMLRQQDELTDWSKSNSSFFKDVSDGDVQQAFAKVSHYVSSLSHMKEGAIEDFLSGADPWLIAFAMAKNFTVVTQESLVSPDVKRKIYIPNVCEALGVAYMNTFELLHELEAEFILSAA